MRRFALILAAPLLLALAARADDPKAPDPRAIVESVKKSHAPAERRELLMEITSKSGRVSKRRLTVLTLTEGDADRLLVRFSEPRDVARLGLLTVQRAGASDEQWLYLPSQKKSKRLASSDRTGLFAGTDFAYEDLRVEDLGKHDYKLLGEEEVAGEACWKIEATPADPDEKSESGYSRRELLISKARPLTLEVRMYDRERGGLVKIVRFSDVRLVAGFPRPHRIEVENRARESRTVAVAVSWNADPSLEAGAFTPFALERGN
jgi:hypothetical protein